MQCWVQRNLLPAQHAAAACLAWWQRKRRVQRGASPRASSSQVLACLRVRLHACMLACMLACTTTATTVAALTWSPL